MVEDPMPPVDDVIWGSDAELPGVEKKHSCHGNRVCGGYVLVHRWHRGDLEVFGFLN